MNLTSFGRLWDRVFNGHRTIGPATIYGYGTAMHGAVNVRVGKTYLCFAWPALGISGCGWRAYLYLSPNATPSASTFIVGGSYYQRRR